MEQLQGSEGEHFMQCPICKQSFDMRDLNQVFAHEHQLACMPTFTFDRGERIEKAPLFYTTLKPVNLN